MDTIKWKKLKEIVKDLTGKEVDITLTTKQTDPVVNSFVIFNPDKKTADILLNGEKCKEVQMVIKAIAHEVAHILLGDNRHGETFKETWGDVENIIRSRYTEGNPDRV